MPLYEYLVIQYHFTACDLFLFLSVYFYLRHFNGQKNVPYKPRP